MAKHSGTPAVRDGRAPGAIVDVVHRRQAHRIARLAFIVAAGSLTPTVAMVAATFASWPAAVVLGLLVGLGTAVVAAVVALVWPALRLIWWWTGELLALVLLLTVYLALVRVVPPLVALMLMAAVAGLLLVVAPSRRWITAWVWCAICRHRLRTCFATFVRVNRRGSIPLILLARPTAAGERVWVLLRPGLSLDDLTTEGGLARLAVGCWAHQVRITRAFSRLSALIRIDITRRNPLSGTVASPIADLVPDLGPDDVDDLDGIDLDTLALELPDVPEAIGDTSAAVSAAAARPRTTSKTPTPTSVSASASPVPAAPPVRPTVLGRGGEDISDWL